MGDAFRCTDCHMSFGTTALLQKHKRKFCVGGSLGDPDNLLLRRGLYTAGSPKLRPLSPDDRKTVLQPVQNVDEVEVVGKKVKQLRALKEKKEKIRDVRNLEERVLLDTLEDTERRLGVTPGRRTRSHLPLSRYPEVRELQLEYENLRDEEQQAAEYRVPLRIKETRLDNMSPMSDTSVSIHLEDEGRAKLDTENTGFLVDLYRKTTSTASQDYAHYNPNQEAQLRQLAETHGRTMEYIQIKNRELEKQREDIRKRLEQLGKRGPPDNNADLLAELRAQEERNQLALNDLRRQLMDMGQKRVNIIKFEILSENIERSGKLLELLQDKLFNDPEFVSLHPKQDASIQLNENSLMNLQELSENNSQGSASQSCDSVVVSADISEIKSSAANFWATSDLQTKNSPADLHRKLLQLQGHLNFISQNLSSRYREVEKHPQPIFQPPPPPPEKEKKSYIYPVYYGNSLVAEIHAMRQAYLQNGGNDPDVLAQLAQMQAEAQKIEDEMKNANYDNRHREKKTDVTGKMTMIQMENERLQKELLLLQEQNFLNQNRRKTDREDDLERELQRLKEQQLLKMMELQNEIALLKQRATLERRPEPPPPQPPQPKNAEMPWLLQRPYVDVEPMQPYDQYPNRYVPGHHTWVSTQYDKVSRQVPPTARPDHFNDNYDEVD